MSAITGAEQIVSLWCRPNDERAEAADVPYFWMVVGVWVSTAGHVKSCGHVMCALVNPKTGGTDEQRFLDLQFRPAPATEEGDEGYP